jgi:hypothetical protein
LTVCSDGVTVTEMLASLPSSAETVGKDRGIMEKTKSEINKIAKRLLQDVLPKKIPLLSLGSR